MTAELILAVDVGGTFTDAVVIAPGGVFTGKSPTTPEDQSAGVLEAAEAALAAASVPASAVDRFVHGMTVTTNALLEGALPRTALLATRGFTDIEELGRQNRPDLYRLCAAPPAPIVPAELRFAIDERCGPGGVIEPLDESSVEHALTACVSAGVESIAVCLLFSFRHPLHERRIAALAEQVAPRVHVSLSHRVVGTFREYERCATTVADAALAPLLSHYLGRLAERADAAGLPAPEVMLSNGGTAPVADAVRRAAATVLSGPAGGAVAVARRSAGGPGAIGFDMGGTSTDVSLAHDGELRLTAGRMIGGRPVALPAADILTVGAGGGSIAWRDSGGALRVGPRSAGARPGPACYGLGGAEPTVTDANFLLGYLDERSGLAGGMRLDRAAAERTMDILASSLKLGQLETAAGIVRIANLEMLRATTAATVARGIDPRDHTLVAFGGAGPMHAAAIADELGIGEIHCPAACGVLSALGMALAGRRSDRSRGVVEPLDEVGADGLRGLIGDLARDLESELGEPRRELQLSFELRYAGQAFELAVDGTTTTTPRELSESFNAAHLATYGFADATARIELVTVRAAAVSPGIDSAGPVSPHSSGDPVLRPPSRVAWFDGEPRETVIAELVAPGAELPGPAVIELPQATIVVPPAWAAFGEADGGVILRRTGAKL